MVVFQSAPPHGGRRAASSIGDTDASVHRVSIRAPARGATHGQGYSTYRANQFQSAPPHGGRPAAAGTADRTTCFNPRPRTGGDERAGPLTFRKPSAVSIRAPARGATGYDGHWLSPERRGFNPRPRTGGDSPIISGRCRQAGRCFNPRPRTGGDRRNTEAVQDRECFNPRPRTGGDGFALASAHSSRNVGTESFNPRPRTGGDSSALRRRRRRPHEFQSAPPHGGRPSTERRRRPSKSTLFQSAPPHGGRRAVPANSRLPGRVINPVFQSAPPHGGRRAIDYRDSPQAQAVSIRAPARGAT